MKMNSTWLAFLIGINTIVCGISACRKANFDHAATITTLYKKYKNGEISQCKYKGETVFTAGLNAYDAGSTVYAADGKQIGICNFAWGQADSICGQLTDCEVIYRVKNNIWGQPAVNKYGL